MDMVLKPEIFFYSFVSLLLGIIAYFLKQLYTDFKRMEKDVTEVKTTTALIKTEFKGIYELMNQRIGYLEKQVNHLKTVFFNKSEYGKERNELG
jgi:hypothetical protein